MDKTAMEHNLQKLVLPDNPAQALPGRTQAMPVPAFHYVNGHSLQGPFESPLRSIQFGMGCFWGAERALWQKEGVHVTAAGYAGGFTPHPNYEEVCSGLTGHTEVVRVIYDPQRVSLDALLALFWEKHNPTQGMRQGNDIGTQYRSAIYLDHPEDLKTARKSLARYQIRLWQQDLGGITTEIKTGQTFFYAEDYHQQYLAKNPGGYCNLQSIDKTCFPAYS
jgi:peptide-methionine (S)-S-oxide reductase